MHGFLEDIGISIVVATVVGILTQRLKQPIILGYLVAGIIIGPEIGPKLVSNPAHIDAISEIGLILLLFIIGLEINPKSILSSGKQILLAGIGQFLICALLGIGFFLLCGYAQNTHSLAALYLSIACAMSSTAIVVKLLSDKFELDTLTGRLTLGVLVFQDVWAILILAVQPNFLNPNVLAVGLAIGKSVALMAFGFLFSKYVLKHVYETNAKAPEMIVAISIGWAALAAGIAGAIGLSQEMGALIAGLAVSSFPYSIHVTAKILPLRDFFLTLFFISLGMKIAIPKASMLLPVLGIVLFVIASRFLSVYPLLVWMGGSSPRTGFIASLNLAQISEFSLVIATLGLSFGHIPRDIFLLILYAMAITSILASYLVKYNYQIFKFAYEKWPGKRGAAVLEPEKAHAHASRPIVILGFHRGAQAMVDAIAKEKPDVLEQIIVVDFNLEVLKQLQAMKIECVFGDITSIDTLTHAHIEEAKIIMSTIPDVLLRGTNNVKLVQTCRLLAPHATIIATADMNSQVRELKTAGANDVILPYLLEGEHLARTVLKWSREVHTGLHRAARRSSAHA